MVEVSWDRNTITGMDPVRKRGFDKVWTWRN